MADIVVRAWVEPIDAQAFAACASFRVMHRGAIFGASGRTRNSYLHSRLREVTV